MEKTKQLLAYLQSVLTIAMSKVTGKSGQKIYDTALSLLGTDASPSDLAPDEYGCAETVSDVLIKAGCILPVILSTRTLYQFFVNSRDWIEVNNPLPGDVIISPTGLGGANGITNGHTGIIGKSGQIMSNNSYTGKFEQNYTIDSWAARYHIKGSYPIYYFRKV